MSFVFGKEEAEKYGNIVSKRLSGKVISKRAVDGDKPNGLRYEAEHLGIVDKDFDLFTLLRTLEGMCALGMAKEIDDCHYKVL